MQEVAQDGTDARIAVFSETCDLRQMLDEENIEVLYIFLPLQSVRAL